MKNPIYLKDYLAECINEGVPAALAGVVELLAKAALEIADEIKASTLNPAFQGPVSINVQGEVQKPLDVLANDIIIAACMALPQVRLAVSEELEDPVACHGGGVFSVIFDPLDGSSNLDVNITVGSIFSIVEAVDLPGVLKSGRSQRFAGYVAYGPATLFAFTFGPEVVFFGAGDNGQWQMISRKHIMPESNGEYSINGSRRSEWPQAIQDFVRDCELGEAGPLGRRYNMRWVGSMVAEVHRILLRGGLFMYPSTSDVKPGKLRLLYEANPMSMILEAAGGLAFDGGKRILDIDPTGIHQRVGVIMGSRTEVSEVRGYFADQT
ncbi:class 1 fructose-bisphosphatase [Rhizobium sp. AU243]|uniref:class 1 fructose-bisphosphatase n=1 Tax=Rhizobium sp. AU243 TaxID=2303425 RepID=UPI001484D6B1|nr:class 1 fructose-bisphosphatase [Rhizobium sp. AU243]